MVKNGHKMGRIDKMDRNLQACLKTGIWVPLNSKSIRTLTPTTPDRTGPRVEWNKHLLEEVRNYHATHTLPSPNSYYRSINNLIAVVVPHFERVGVDMDMVAYFVPEGIMIGTLH